MTERYFDHAASTPPFPEALHVQQHIAAEYFGNPSSLHQRGNTARERLKQVRSRFCELCGFDDGRLILTSGGTEANNLVIYSALADNPDKKIAIAADAHASMAFARQTAPERSIAIPLTSDGFLDMTFLNAMKANEIALCCITHASNETGIIHDVDKIAELCLRKNIPLQCDGVQALGKIPVDLHQIDSDYYTFSGHKFGGPHGVGGVFTRSPLHAQLQGGFQEWAIRAGTENVAGFAGVLTALELSLASRAERNKRLRQLVCELVEQLIQSGLCFELNSDLENGLPGLVSLSFPNRDGSVLVRELDLRGFCIATGSACHENVREPSPVILAMGRPPEVAAGTIRISMGNQNTSESVQELGRAIVDIINS